MNKIETYGPICQCRFSKYCTNTPDGLQHLVKKSHGGADTDENTLLCCNVCNMEIEDRPEDAARAGLNPSLARKLGIA